MKEITVRVLKIIRLTFRNTTYCKKFRFRFTCNINNFDGMENGGG